MNEAFSLVGGRALVTGGSRGLGRAIAAGLVDAGALVAVVSRTASEVEEAVTALGPNAFALARDISVGGEESTVVDQAEDLLGGPLDIVVHAAGVQHRQAAEEFDPGQWDHILRINLTAPFMLSKEIGARQLARGAKGSHIFIGSLTSLLSIPDVSAYTASKSGICGVMRNLSTEWSGRGIRVNAIAPGYFRTELTEAVFADPERYQKMLDRIPMGRFGNPQELAGTAVYLASDASSYTTGQLLTIDGGWTAS